MAIGTCGNPRRGSWRRIMNASILVYSTQMQEKISPPPLPVKYLMRIREGSEEMAYIIRDNELRTKQQTTSRQTVRSPSLSLTPTFRIPLAFHEPREIYARNDESSALCASNRNNALVHNGQEISHVQHPFPVSIPLSHLCTLDSQVPPTTPFRPPCALGVVSSN